MDAIKALADPGLREAARESLAARGLAAVRPLLDELLDETSPVPRREIEFVLTKRIGPAAFDEVLAALAAAEDDEPRHRLGGAFRSFRTVDRYVEALSHPSAEVRCCAIFGIQDACSVANGAGPEPGVDYGLVIDALIPLLADPDGEVAWWAERVLKVLGPGVVEPLCRVRGHGPGRLRSRALTVLASVGGEEALSPADRAAVDRLIRIKLTDDEAQPLNVGSTSWIAVPTGDQRGVMELLGLFDARPATFALGLSVGMHDSHDGVEHGRVYVTPEVEGWTLVLGPWCDPGDPERAEDVLRVVTDLSRRYGWAQAYHFVEEDGGSAWLFAENGTVVRRFRACWEDDDARFTLGEPLPEERAAYVEAGSGPVGDAGADDEEWTGLAAYLAEQLSVSPLDLGPHTTVCGVGAVALTPYAREHGRPNTGAYAI